MPHVDIPITGYSDFDQEHKDLIRFVETLGGLCAQPATRRLACACCSGDIEAGCAERLVAMLEGMHTHMADHFRYEEALMDRLADWQGLRSHIEAHKRAHVEIGEDFERFFATLDMSNPGIASQRLKETILTMISRHVRDYDATFARLLAYADKRELRLDPEILELLQSISQKTREE